jgi:hypothetical protein
MRTVGRAGGESLVAGSARGMGRGSCPEGLGFGEGMVFAEGMVFGKNPSRNPSSNGRMLGIRLRSAARVGFVLSRGQGMVIFCLAIPVGRTPSGWIEGSKAGSRWNSSCGLGCDLWTLELMAAASGVTHGACWG